MLLEATIRALSEQARLFEKAATFPGRPRERIVALSEAEDVFFRLHPYHYRAMQVIRVASQLSKAATRRRDVLRKCENRLVSLLMNVIGDAVRVGDLRFAGLRRPEELAFTLWALAFGTRALTDTAVTTAHLGIQDGLETSRAVVHTLLDALGWQPLSNEWDYDRTRERVRAELFAEELRRIPEAPHVHVAASERAARSEPLRLEQHGAPFRSPEHRGAPGGSLESQQDVR